MTQLCMFGNWAISGQSRKESAAESSMASGKSPRPDLLKAEEQQQVSAVNRVTSLPLLNSAFNLVSSAYNHTKESHPCLGGVCSVAETVAAVAMGSVVGGAQPILTQLEPQIALVNEYACKGLDQLEETLPFLQHPADKVISDTKQLVSTKVTSAMDAACEARGAVAEKVTEAVDITKNVVGDSVKLTRSVVTSTVNSAVEAAQGAKDLVTNKVTEAVDVTKHMVEDSVDKTKYVVTSTIVNAVEAAQGAKDLMTNKVTEAVDVAKDLVTNKVTEAVDLSKHMVEDSVDRTKSAVASTITAAVGAAQGAKELVTNKVTEAVDVTKHMVEDSVDRTKSAVASTIVNAVEAAQGAKDLVTNKVTEAVDVTKHMVEDGVDRTKSAVASTIVSALEAAQGAKELVTDKVTKAVDLSKHIVEDSVDMTKSAVASTIVNAVEAAQGAKDLVTNKVTEAVDLTKGAVQDGVEKTKSVVTSTVSTALDAAYGTITGKLSTALEQGREALQEGVEMTNSVVANSISKAKAVSQAVAGGVESVLGMSEDLVDHFLPMTEEELGGLAVAVEGVGMVSVEEQRRQRSYFVRLGSLSGTVRHRAHQHSLRKLQGIRHCTQDTLSRLQRAIKLIQSVKQEVGQKLLERQQKLHQLWVDWCLTQPKGNQVQTACQPEVESRTLTMLRIITHQLQPVYENLKTSIQGLPSSIQEVVYQATRSIHRLHSSFSSAMSFQDLSSATLRQSRDRVAEARGSLDVLFEYVTHNIPLNWLVGPFRAIAQVAQDSRKQQKKDVVTDRKLPVLEKALSWQEVTETPKEPKGTNRIPEEGCAVLEKLEEKTGMVKKGEKREGKAENLEEKTGKVKKAEKREGKAGKVKKGEKQEGKAGKVKEKTGKMEEKAEKDIEVALAAREIKTSAPEEDL
ncbi:perilipin-3-like isoform X1 [Willisornis vidua]|uniref:Perilipin-3-like isoform X1 n=1 Tax=Willisornis vidua TaxID=1566151 RepID=A0ABQ9DSL0_9PASS|nr:perilipin-3-like isoform X1 [Willisornis vidua]